MLSRLYHCGAMNNKLNTGPKIDKDKQEWLETFEDVYGA
jgi:hypothetical protein